MTARIARFIGWLRRRFSRPQFTRVAVVPELPDVPADLLSHTIYVAGAQTPKWAVFRCPCRQGHVVTLSLQRSHQHSWALKVEGALPSIHPSVDVRGRARCHYFVRDGRIVWIADDDAA